MRTSEYEGVILIPPHTCRLKISTRNTRFDMLSSAHIGGASHINKGTLYEYFGEEGQLKQWCLATGEWCGLPLVNRWVNSPLILYWVPPSAQFFLRLHSPHGQLAFNFPPPPNCLYCQDRKFLPPICGGRQYFFLKEAMKGRTGCKIQHHCFTI